jgi:hypothetical protein
MPTTAVIVQSTMVESAPDLPPVARLGVYHVQVCWIITVRVARRFLRTISCRYMKSNLRVLQSFKVDVRPTW